MPDVRPARDHFHPIIAAKGRGQPDELRHREARPEMGVEDFVQPEHEIPDRIALGPHQGRKAFTLLTVPVVDRVDDGRSVAKAAGFS